MATFILMIKTFQSTFTTRTAQILILLSLTPLAIPQPAYADFFIHGWENLREQDNFVRLEGDIHAYSSKQNFNQAGTKVIPTGLRTYDRTGTNLTGIFGISERFSAFGRLNWTRVSVESTTVDAYTFGFADQSFGANLRLIGYRGPSRDPFKLDAQMQFDVPGYSNPRSRADRVPFLGDGSVDFTAGLFGTLTLLRAEDFLLSMTGGAGYQYRSANFSGAVPYSALFDLSTSGESGLLAQLGVLGQFSTKSDAQPGASPTTGGDSSMTGGSFASNAVNPVIHRFRALVGFQFDPSWKLKGSIEAPISGSNSPSGNLFSIGITHRFGGKYAKTPRSEEEETLDSIRRNRGTKEKTIRGGFTTYSMEAKVLRVNDRLNLLKINRGASANVEAGQTFDIFSAKTDGTADSLIARARVKSVTDEEAALEILEYYKEVWINEGFIAKRVSP